MPTPTDNIGKDDDIGLKKDEHLARTHKEDWVVKTIEIGYKDRRGIYVNELWHYSDWEKTYLRTHYWFVDINIDDLFMQWMCDKHFTYIIDNPYERERLNIEDKILTSIEIYHARMYREAQTIMKEIEKLREQILPLHEDIEKLEKMKAWLEDELWVEIK